MWILPPGFTFKPSDEELVNHYLKRKLYGYLPVEVNVQDDLVIPDHLIIPEKYIYDYDPWELQELFREQSLAQLDNGECYFFCPRRNKYRRGHEENRSTKSGYWKPRGKKIIRTSQITAEKIRLTFYHGHQQNAILTKYKMHQYKLVSNNKHDNDTPKEMLCDLCYIFLNKTKLDQEDNAPICNEGNSSTSMISTANGSEIYISQFESNNQGDQTTELEETYKSQLLMYCNTDEIYPTQHNYDVNRELVFPSTNYAYAGSYNSQILGDHQGDQSMESEEFYSSLPPLIDNFNMINPPKLIYDIGRE